MQKCLVHSHMYSNIPPSQCFRSLSVWEKWLILWLYNSVTLCSLFRVSHTVVVSAVMSLLRLKHIITAQWKRWKMPFTCTWPPRHNHNVKMQNTHFMLLFSCQIKMQQACVDDTDDLNVLLWEGDCESTRVSRFSRLDDMESESQTQSGRQRLGKEGELFVRNTNVDFRHAVVRCYVCWVCRNVLLCHNRFQNLAPGHRARLANQH